MQFKKLFEIYMLLPVVALLIGCYVVFFGEDRYRYECQNPDFWEAPQCNPPICLATGTCTSDLISLDGNYSNRYSEQVDQFMSSVETEGSVSAEESSEVPETVASEEENVDSIIEENSNTFELEASPEVIDGINQLIEENTANE
jgi:hypothetical protein